MKKFRILFFLGVAGCFAGCHTGDSKQQASSSIDSAYTVEGTITGQDTGMVYLLHYQTQDHVTDSIRLNHGHFVFKGLAVDPEWCFWGIEKDGRKNFYKTFFLANGETLIQAKKDSLFIARISGTAVQNELNAYDSIFQAMKLRMDSTEKKYYIARSRNEKSVADSLDKAYSMLETEKTNRMLTYIKAHPDSYVSAYEIFKNLTDNPDPAQLDSFYAGLNNRIRESYFGKKIHDIANQARQTAVGQQAPDFSGMDPQGKTVTLSSYKGKLVLIDFWASWCGPCRRENPNVVKAYGKFHRKGFDILGVSLDTKKEHWIDAIKKDHLSWTQVSDLKGWKSDLAALYGVEAIPMNFLVDKDGRILAKGLEGEALTKKLQDLFQ